MKILSVITELAPGGAEKVVLELASGLRQRGVENVILSLKPAPHNRNLVDEMQEHGIRVRFLNSGKWNPLLVFKLRKAICEESPDLIHSHLIHPNILTRLAACKLKIPLVNTIHIAEHRKRQGIFFLLDRLTFFRCNVCTAVSYAAAEFHEQRCLLPHGTICVVYNGADPVAPPADTERESCARRWGWTAQTKKFGLLGRLNQQKGFDLLLRVLPEIAKKVPSEEDWSFVIIGEGPERAALEKQIGTMTLPSHVHVQLAGFYPNASSIMNLFDVFVMPSRYEGYGLTLVEAMNWGLPVVCNPVDSLPELCRLYSGHAFPADFSSMDRDRIFEALWEASRLPHSEPFSVATVNQMVDTYLSIYRDLLQKGDLF